jgi:hypothetical protein
MAIRTGQKHEYLTIDNLGLSLLRSKRNTLCIHIPSMLNKYTHLAKKESKEAVKDTRIT